MSVIIKSAKFVSPHSRNTVIIQMRINHDGVAGSSYVSCRANTKTYELIEFSGIKDGPAGDALIAYLRKAALGGKMKAAIDHPYR